MACWWRAEATRVMQGWYSRLNNAERGLFNNFMDVVKINAERGRFKRKHLTTEYLRDTLKATPGEWDSLLHKAIAEDAWAVDGEYIQVVNWQNYGNDTTAAERQARHRAKPTAPTPTPLHDSTIAFANWWQLNKGGRTSRAWREHVNAAFVAGCTLDYACKTVDKTEASEKPWAIAEKVIKAWKRKSALEAEAAKSNAAHAAAEARRAEEARRDREEPGWREREAEERRQVFAGFKGFGKSD